MLYSVRSLFVFFVSLWWIIEVVHHKVHKEHKVHKGKIQELIATGCRQNSRTAAAISIAVSSCNSG